MSNFNSFSMCHIKCDPWIRIPEISSGACRNNSTTQLRCIAVQDNFHKLTEAILWNDQLEILKQIASNQLCH